MENQIQTILGGGGAIGKLLAHDLLQYTKHVRIVGRNPQRVNVNDEIVKADLLNKEQTINAIKGSAIAYLVAGVPYQSYLWEKQWPVIMQNVIEACAMHKVKLVFFDNVYAYDPNHFQHLIEDSPLRSVSRKGAVREQITNMILCAVKQNRIQAIIARSADFYGPNTAQSILNIMIIQNMVQGKKPNWYIDPERKHSFTYTPDASKATAMLGNTPSAFNQVWHLPTITSTARKITEVTSKILGTQSDIKILPAWMIKILGWFIPVIGESQELLYQFKNDYVMDSRKFTNHFGWEATPLQSGIEKTVLSIQTQQTTK